MKLRPALLRMLIDATLRTVSFTVRNGAEVDAMLAVGKSFVFVFWHGSMLYPWWRMRGIGAAALVSRSRDGQLLSEVLTKWGYQVLRGSSSRGSKEAMADMRAALADGRVLCVTPDGPRGPVHEMKMGAVRAAQTMGVPLVCVAVGYRHARLLRSWDHFAVPLPWTSATVEYSRPIVIDPLHEGEALENTRADIEKLLLAMHRRVGCKENPG